LIPKTRTGATYTEPGVRQTWRRAGNAARTADNESKTTTDHDEIRRWAEERGGKPAKVKVKSGDESRFFKLVNR
jgi:hypothetical protein